MAGLGHGLNALCRGGGLAEGLVGAVGYGREKALGDLGALGGALTRTHGCALLFTGRGQFVRRHRTILIRVHGIENRLAEPGFVNAQALAAVAVQVGKKFGGQVVRSALTG